MRLNKKFVAGTVLLATTLYAALRWRKGGAA